MKDIVLFDLDNTLANNNHRQHLITGPDADWKSFDRSCVSDTLIESAWRLHNSLRCSYYRTWIISGRSEEVRGYTEDWLAANHMSWDMLLMRPVGDHCTNDELKKRWLNDGTIDKSRVLCAFDDNEATCKMFQSEGIPAFRVLLPK